MRLQVPATTMLIAGIAAIQRSQKYLVLRLSAVTSSNLLTGAWQNRRFRRLAQRSSPLPRMQADLSIRPDSRRRGPSKRRHGRADARLTLNDLRFQVVRERNSARPP